MANDKFPTRRFMYMRDAVRLYNKLHTFFAVGVTDCTACDVRWVPVGAKTPPSQYRFPERRTRLPNGTKQYSGAQPYRSPTFAQFLDYYNIEVSVA